MEINNSFTIFKNISLKNKKILYFTFKIFFVLYKSKNVIIIIMLFLQSYFIFIQHKFS